MVNVFTKQPNSSLTLNHITTVVYANGENSTQKYTMDEILNEVKKLMLDSAFPVGSIYISDNNDDTCPIQTKLGGKWALIKTGRVLQQADSTNQPKTYIAAGVPNIKGTTFADNIVQQQWKDLYKATLTGCFFADTSYGERELGMWMNGTDRDNIRIGFDSSRGTNAKNSAGKKIYQDDCTTVQPEAYAVNIWRRTS